MILIQKSAAAAVRRGMEPVNTQQKQVERNEIGQFMPGSSGNPAGRPPGARNHTTLLAEQLFDGASGALANKAVQMALEGITIT
jgi:hypothetical protein